MKGKDPAVNTGFDIHADDLLDMKACRGIVVASAIFGKLPLRGTCGQRARLHTVLHPLDVV